MIRLATVFSGIGAIEHALDRMKLKHKIIFACDNGDIDILAKKIGVNVDDIGEELEWLTHKVGEVHYDEGVQSVYKEQLVGMLKEARNEYVVTVDQLEKLPKNPGDLSLLLTRICSSEDVTQFRKREYQQFREKLECGSKLQRRFFEQQVILKIVNDFKKDNNLEMLGFELEFKSADGIEWKDFSKELKNLYDYLEKCEGMKIIRKVQDLSQRVSQLHEKINSISVQKKLETFGEDWGERKAFIDSLYSGMEKRNKVKQSYMANYDVQKEDFHWDAVFLDGRQYEGQVDLFVGGSPCQSFSFVGKQRGLDDTRGTLFYEYARLIDEIKPKVFIYENVRAVTTHDGGKTWKKMQQVFEELGYDFSWEILNAKNYGIPQNRERVFVVGLRRDLKLKEPFSFPKPIPLKKIMQDFLIDNMPEAETDSSDLEKYFLSEKAKKYVLSTGTKNFYSKPETDLDIARPLLTTMHKMHRSGVDNYVTTQGRLRKLTPRECLRLMGFGDCFKIVVSDTAMYQQAGNSIVVDVLIAIMNQIMKSVDFSENVELFEAEDENK